MIPFEQQGGCCLARYNASSAVLPSKKEHILSRYRPIAPRPAAPRPIAPKPDTTTAGSPPPASDLQSSSSLSVGSRAAPGSSDVTTSTTGRGRRSRKRCAADRAGGGGGGGGGARASSSSNKRSSSSSGVKAGGGGGPGMAVAAASASGAAQPCGSQVQGQQQQQGQHQQTKFLSRFGLASDLMSSGADSILTEEAAAAAAAAAEAAAAAAALAAPGGAHTHPLTRTPQQQQHHHQRAHHHRPSAMAAHQTPSLRAEGSLSSVLTLSSGTALSCCYEDPYTGKMLPRSPYSSVSGSIFQREDRSHMSSSAGSFRDNGGGGPPADRDVAFMERAAASVPAATPHLFDKTAAGPAGGGPGPPPPAVAVGAASAPVSTRLLHSYSGGFSNMLKGIAGGHGGVGIGVGGSAAPCCTPPAAHHQQQQQQHVTMSASGSAAAAADLDLNAAAAKVANSLDLNRVAQSGGDCLSPARLSLQQPQRRPAPLLAIGYDAMMMHDLDRQQQQHQFRGGAGSGRPQLVTLPLLPDTPSHHARVGAASDAASSGCTSVGLTLSSDHAMMRQDAAQDTGAAPCRESALYATGRCLEDRFELLRSRELERDKVGGGQAMEAKPLLLLDTFRELVSRASSKTTDHRLDTAAEGVVEGEEHHHHQHQHLHPHLQPQQQQQQQRGHGHHLLHQQQQQHAPGHHQQQPKVIDLAYLEQVYSASSDPLMLTDENQVVMWYNPAFKRASSERNSRQGHAMSPYIDPLGVPTRLSVCVFEASPSAKCRAVLWGFLKKFVTQEEAGGGGSGSEAPGSSSPPGGGTTMNYSSSSPPGGGTMNYSSGSGSSMRLGGGLAAAAGIGGAGGGMSASPQRSSGQVAQEKRLMERNFFGLGLPSAVDHAAAAAACQIECSQPVASSSHTVIAPQAVRPVVGSLGNSTTLTRLLAAVKPSP